MRVSLRPLRGLLLRRVRRVEISESICVSPTEAIALRVENDE